MIDIKGVSVTDFGVYLLVSKCGVVLIFRMCNSLPTYIFSLPERRRFTSGEILHLIVLLVHNQRIQEISVVNLQTLTLQDTSNQFFSIIFLLHVSAA